jgi:hypothetical protein
VYIYVEPSPHGLVESNEAITRAWNDERWRDKKVVMMVQLTF